MKARLGSKDIQKLSALCIRIANESWKEGIGNTHQKDSRTAIGNIAIEIMNYYIDRGIEPKDIDELIEKMHKND